MNKEKYYLNPQTNKIDTWESWVKRIQKISTDIEPFMEILEPVKWDFEAQAWAKDEKNPTKETEAY